MKATDEVMTVAEAEERFAGNYLALEIVKRDRQHNPWKVRLIAKAKTPAALFRKTHGVREMAVIYAGPLVPEGTVMLY